MAQYDCQDKWYYYDRNDDQQSTKYDHGNANSHIHDISSDNQDYNIALSSARAEKLSQHHRNGTLYLT